MPYDGSEITVTDLAYAAGMLDGEGNVSVKRGGYKRRETWNREYRVYVTVANTNKLVIDWFIAKFGGSLKINKRKENPKFKVCYSWVISAKTAVYFLKLVRPYLIVKSEQADICLTFQTTVLKTGKPLTLDVVEKREELYHATKLLNMRGVQNAL